MSWIQTAYLRLDVTSLALGAGALAALEIAIKEAPGMRLDTRPSLPACSA